MSIAEIDDYAEEDDREQPRDVRWLTSVIDHPNIAEEIDKTTLAMLGDRVVAEYEIDRKSCAEYEQRLEKAMKLAMQVVEAKNHPWPKASNVKYPIMVKAAIHFGANAYPAIVPDGDVVKGRVIGNDSGKPAMDPQTGQPAMQPMGQDPETGEPIMGPVWEIPPGAKRQRAERVAKHMSWQLIEDMPEWEEETDSLLHILPIVGCLFRKTYYDSDEGRNISELCTPRDLVVNYNTRSLEAARRVTHVIDLLPHEIMERERGGLFREVEIGQPTGEDVDDDSSPHCYLEQARRWDLDGDGYPEPYTVTVHKDTRQVVRIIARFDEQGLVTNTQGEVAKITPIQHYTKYGFIPSPDGGFYDMGFGTLLYPLNEVVNTTINQMIDAGTLQNTGGGLISGGPGLSGRLRFKPGEFKVVKGVSGPLRDNIYERQHPGPSAVLFSLLGMLAEAADDLASVKDIMTGEMPAQNMPATLGLALIERGMKMFTAIYKRVHRSLKQEFKKLYRLNSIHLPEQVYVSVLDETMTLGRADYTTTDFDIVPVSDPTVVTDMQKLGRAEFLMQFRHDPLVNQVNLYNRIFDAATIEDLDDLLMTEPPVDPEIASAADKQALEIRKVELDEQKADLEARKMAIAETEAEIEAEKAAVEMDVMVADAELKAAQEIKALAQADKIEGDSDGA